MQTNQSTAATTFTRFFLIKSSYEKLRSFKDLSKKDGKKDQFGKLNECKKFGWDKNFF